MQTPMKEPVTVPCDWTEKDAGIVALLEEIDSSKNQAV